MLKFNKWQLLIVVFILSLIISLLAVFYYNSESEEINENTKSYLTAVNDLKIDQISTWRKERLSTAKFFPTISKFITYTSLLKTDRKNKEAIDYFNSALNPFRLNHYYENIFIADVNFKILYSLDTEFKSIDSLTVINIKKAVDADSVSLTDFYFSEKDSAIYFDLISPIKDNKGNKFGAIVQKVNPSYQLFPLVHKWATQSKTAETLMFKKVRDGVVFLHELKEDKNSDLSFSIPLSESEDITVKGILGSKGPTEGKDYRGHEVLADINILPGTDWYIASKIDTDELHSDIIFRGETIIIIVVVSILSLVFGFLFLYKSKQSKIYKELFLNKQKLLEMQEEFRTILYSIGDAVITTDYSGNVRQMNEVAEQLTGWKESEARGIILNKVFNIISEDTRVPVINPVQKVMKEGLVVGLANHTILVSKHGKEIPISDSGAPIKDAEGKIIGVVLVFRDQTDERERERQLLENIQKYKLIFNSAFVAIVFSHLKTGRLVEINDSFSNIFGYNRDEVIGKSINELELWADIFDREKIVEELRSAGIITDMEIIGKRKNGSLFTGLISANTIAISDDIFIYTVVRDITEKKKTEEAVQMFKFVSDFAPLSIFWLNEQAGFDYVNEQACNSLGYTREELMKLNLFDIDPDYPKETWIARWKNSQGRKLTSELIESSHQRKDGTRFPIEVVVQHYLFNNTNLHVAFVQDITKRKEAEAELRFNEERYKKLFDHSPVGILFQDEDGIIQVVNDAHCKITGYSKDELVGRSISTLTPPDKQEIIESNIKEILSGKILDHAVETIRKDGSKITVRLTETRIVLNNNKQGVLSISYDITEIIRAQSELKKLSRAVEQSPATIMITDINGQIEYVNPKFCEITGYTMDEVLNKNPRFLSSGNKKKSEYTELWDTILSGKEWRGEFYNKKKNGELFWESAIISSIVDKDGVITNFISVKEDITVQKKLTEELIKAKEKAEEMNRIKSYFYANMSHELRTPFVGILGYSELLSELLTDEDHRDMANQILNSSRRLTDTLNKVLNITKLEFDKINPIYVDVNLLDLLEDIKSLFIASAKQKNTEMVIEYNSADHSIVTDEKLMREILTNLINNAVKFTSNGKIIISFENYADDSGNKSFIIKISDTGMGIPKEKHQVIWEEFRQASEGLNRSFEGTGLGLTITKKYCEILGGQISMESEAGKGSVFTVKLPVQKSIFETHQDIETEIIPGNNSPVTIVNNHPRILYIEDDVVAQDFVKLILTRIECVVEIISEAEIALNHVNEKKFDVILIDINLGYGMDGVEVMQRIRQFPAYEKVPIVAITAYASESDKEEFLSKGFSLYLSKPFTIDELKSTVKSAFNLNQNQLNLI